MTYVGLQNQIWRNNFWSAILLLSFPAIFASLIYLFFLLLSWDQWSAGVWGYLQTLDFNVAKQSFLERFPFVWIWVFLWFVIAFFSHSSMIKKSVWAKWISRKENPELYNLLENLCISQWMKMPKLAIIEDSSLNAFASWINDNTYTITLSRWIIEKLEKEELETVIAHELWHIRNRDTRLLIISIIFVWIFSFLAEILFRSLRWWSKQKWWLQIIIVGIVVAIIWYIFAFLVRFALSRKREYLADAFSAQITKNPRALASALRKISWDPVIEALKRKDLAQAFIENPKVKHNFFSFWGLFSTHPPVQKRIEILENF